MRYVFPYSLHEVARQRENSKLSSVARTCALNSLAAVSSYSKFPTYIVDDVLLSIVVIRVRWVDGTYYIDLIILERCIVLVHVDYMICVVYSKSATKKGPRKYNI